MGHQDGAFEADMLLAASPLPMIVLRAYHYTTQTCQAYRSLG